MVAVGSVWLRKGERAGDIKNACGRPQLPV